MENGISFASERGGFYGQGIGVRRVRERTVSEYIGFLSVHANMGIFTDWTCVCSFAECGSDSVLSSPGEGLVMLRK